MTNEKVILESVWINKETGEAWAWLSDSASRWQIIISKQAAMSLIESEAMLVTSKDGNNANIKIYSFNTQKS